MRDRSLHALLALIHIDLDPFSRTFPLLATFSALEAFSPSSPARIRAMRPFLPFLFSLFFGVSVQAQWWKVQTSGLDTNLRGVSAAYTPGEKGVPVPVVWASGSNGVILRSLDEGKTWKWTRHLQRSTPGPDATHASYPSIVQARDGTRH